MTSQPPQESAPSSNAQVTSARRKNSLRFKFLSRHVVMVMACAVVLMSIWEYFGYRSAINELEKKLNEVVSIQGAILENPVWNFETDRIELILRSILQDQDFVSALVTDETGNTLAFVGQRVQAPLLTSSQAIVRDQGQAMKIIGELTIVASDERIDQVVLKRIQIDLAIVLLLLLSAVAAAFQGFERTINLPLSRLLEAINQSKQSGQRQEVEWESDDEMGKLVEEFNAFQRQSQLYEEEMKGSKALLEARVRERTEDLEKARDAATDANRAKSEFLAVMSHELRTPLNGILGLTENLKDCSEDPEQCEQLSLIKDSGETLLGLLNDILDLSKIEAGSMTLEERPFSLQDHINKTAGIWSSLADNRGLQFELSLPDEPLPAIVGDETRLRQMLNNFFNNAFKFTEKGSVGLTVSHQKKPNGKIELRFEISDTGIGIDPSLHDSIFAKFTQADGSTTRRFGGTGLGLTICKEFAELMGGGVGLSSEEGEGSCF